jgi:CRP/FNR family transcriptional regulator
MASKDKDPSCFSCQTRQISEWCCLTDAELCQIDRVKAFRDYGPGEIIYHQGESCEGVFCLESGLVGIRRLDEKGNSTLLRLINAGQTVGYRAFLRKAPHDNSAEVLMPSRICHINRSTVRSLLETNPTLGLSFLDHSLDDLAHTEDQYMESTTCSVRIRLLHALLVLYERFGFESEEGEPHLELPISRQDLAGLIGTAPETMSRTIQRIQMDGLVEFKGRTVRIRDLNSICQTLAIRA